MSLSPYKEAAGMEGKKAIKPSLIQNPMTSRLLYFNVLSGTPDLDDQVNLS